VRRIRALASLRRAASRLDVVPRVPGRISFLEGMIAPLDLEVLDSEPERVNLLIPRIELTHLFGGYIAKFNLARRLAERGIRTRLVCVLPSGRLPADWMRRVESYRGLSGLFGEVEVAFARDADRPLALNPHDSLLATTWWTAQAARAALQELERERFVYLIQEYEPFTYPMGTQSALARETYELPHLALFSTELLREYFRRHEIGVFARGDAEGERDSISFQNAITPLRTPSQRSLAERRSRRLLFYARRELHATRNMFELGVMALRRAVADSTLEAEWEVQGIGAVAGSPRVALGGGRVMRILPRRDQDAYARLLESHDVGLSLMYTPHPSLVPIEMASAGMLAVTNTFENKTPEALARISENLVAVEPTLEGVVDGLRRAVAEVGDVERRVRGAAVEWSADWDSALDEEVMRGVASFLAAS
jgi:hypothetical protein